MLNRHLFSLAFLLLLAILPIQAQAEVAVPQVISTHMVLQRDMKDPIWGTAAPQEKVIVKFRDQTKQTAADSQGNWMLKLDELKAGGPDTLTITGNANTITIEDVLVGEVWLGSGQSNMETDVDFYRIDKPLKEVVDAGPYPKLRLIKNVSDAQTAWMESTPENAHKFSALGFSFAYILQKQLDVPVGIMVGSISGTPSGWWLPREAHDTDPVLQAMIKKINADRHFDESLKKYADAKAAYDDEVAAAKKEGRAVTIKPPAAPIAAGESGNPNEIGYLYVLHVKPFVPYGIRGVLWDQGESGVDMAGIDQYTAMGALIRGWRKAFGEGDFPFLYVQKPSGAQSAYDLKDPVTISANGFNYIQPSQLAEGPIANDPGAFNRENFNRILQYPNTYMITASDMNAGLHPAYKFAYGARCARVAFGAVYQQKVEIYGPIYKSYKIEGDKVRIAFTHVGAGLAINRGEKVQGFIIASEDRKFYWADATIDGDTIVVSSEKVPDPKGVRYAWAQELSWANLFNKDGLPALTFRTDDW